MNRQKWKEPDKNSSPARNAPWQSWYASNGSVLRFVLQFGFLLALFYGLSATPCFDRMLFAYLEANARLSNILLNGFGQHTQVFEVTIESAQFAIAVRRGCDAVEPTWLFCAAVLCFRAPLEHKLLGIVAATVLLQLLNVVRIASLYWIGLRLPAFFNLAHLEIWPAVFILVAIVLFMVWIDWTRQDTPTDAIA